MHQNGSYLLDTNIIIGLFNRDQAIQEKMRIKDRVFLAAPAIGELYYGARKSNKAAENIAKVNRITQQFPLYSCNLETAQRYGYIKDQLRQKGSLIPDNDIWIAAVAIQHGLILATRDSHFDEIESLQTERW
ncbi:type II toxin-antitoxin system VapC family toxin [Candidatus Poribacteria bacterium]|nr:type II toxin-antitoxin system VapC family toxin [Candidatus Poribacteria bacterium]MYF56728.1 type II toxin-antitoxin system VapC family toxin [Candidatus Poribacteria bacterium]